MRDARNNVHAERIPHENTVRGVHLRCSLTCSNVPHRWDEQRGSRCPEQCPCAYRCLDATSCGTTANPAAACLSSSTSLIFSSRFSPLLSKIRLGFVRNYARFLSLCLSSLRARDPPTIRTLRGGTGRRSRGSTQHKAHRGRRVHVGHRRRIRWLNFCHSLFPRSWFDRGVAGSSSASIFVAALRAR